MVCKVERYTRDFGLQRCSRGDAHGIDDEHAWVKKEDSQ